MKLWDVVMITAVVIGALMVIGAEASIGAPLVPGEWIAVLAR